MNISIKKNDLYIISTYYFHIMEIVSTNYIYFTYQFNLRIFCFMLIKGKRQVS